MIVHTNLGRAPLAAAAREAVARAARGLLATSSSDLATGARGSRHDARRGAAARADRRRGGARGQQRRGRGAARRGRAGRAGPRGRRLARPARGDRRRLPRARGDRPGGRAARRGRHHEPHAAAPTTSARSAPDTGAILRVHPSNFRQLGFVAGGRDRGAVRARRAGDRRRRLGRASSSSCWRRAAGAALGRGRRGARVLLRRQAARRPAGRADGRARGGGRRGARATRWRARCGSTSSSLAALEATLRLHRDPSGAARDPGAGDAHAPTRSLARPRGAAGRAVDRRRGGRGRSRGSAAARCRCSSCPGRSSRCPARPTRSPRRCAPATRR